jgi:KAP family P-loop domain
VSPMDLSDRPLEKPDDDLLGVSRFPRKLAELINETKGSLTVGVYGPWGSGKTSLIQLVRYHLERSNPPFDFIAFSAWPYRTADELWRAMMLQIARAIYRIPDDPAGGVGDETDGDEPDVPGGLIGWLRRFLTGDALVMCEPTPEQTPRRQYDQLVTRLDGTPYGTIAKDSGQRLKIDQEEAAMAVVKAALAGLGTLSPLLAGLRGLLGLGGEVDLAAAIRREKNVAIRQRIASVDQFKKAFRELFGKALAGRRLCVFVDDLDRCMPDVALDLLEAIKIVLVEFPWVFLVAADQELISRGLRLRYRGLADEAALEADRAGLEQKGREYFEKIIQLHIPVPVPNEDQLQRFVAVQFPRLSPAGDIVLLAAGDNPRRIKQYCQWLQYKQGVFEEPEEA